MFVGVSVLLYMRQFAHTEIPERLCGYAVQCQHMITNYESSIKETKELNSMRRSNCLFINNNI